MNKRNIGFWVATGLFSLAIFPGAIMDIIQPDFMVEAANTMQLPVHLFVLIGIWKMLGVVALLLPRFRTLNEWAYAGFLFDLTGASFSHASVGDTWASVLIPLAYLPILGVSYWLRPKA